MFLNSLVCYCAWCARYFKLGIALLAPVQYTMCTLAAPARKLQLLSASIVYDIPFRRSNLKIPTVKQHMYSTHTQFQLENHNFSVHMQYTSSSLKMSSCQYMCMAKKYSLATPSNIATFEYQCSASLKIATVQQLHSENMWMCGLACTQAICWVQNAIVFVIVFVQLTSLASLLPNKLCFSIAIVFVILLVLRAMWHSWILN